MQLHGFAARDIAGAQVNAKASSPPAIVIKFLLIGAF